jgi:hypothetical protein
MGSRGLFWKLIGIIAIVLISSAMSVPRVYAMIDEQVNQFIHMVFFPYSDVTITATPIFGSMPLTDFEVNQVKGDVTVTWNNAPTTANVMVRAKKDGYPTSLTDGWQVYTGSGESAIDYEVNTDDNISDIFYAGWSENATNVWSTPVNDLYKVTKMALILVTGGLLGLAFWQKKSRYGEFLQIVASIVAIAFGAYWIAEYEGFIYVIEGTVSVAIGIWIMIGTALELIRGN